MLNVLQSEKNERTLQIDWSILTLLFFTRFIIINVVIFIYCLPCLNPQAYICQVKNEKVKNYRYFLIMDSY